MCEIQNLNLPQRFRVNNTHRDKCIKYLNYFYIDSSDTRTVFRMFTLHIAAAKLCRESKSTIRHALKTYTRAKRSDAKACIKYKVPYYF